MSPQRLFRSLAIAEAITWTLLITALLLRATAGLGQAVLVGGSIHGFVFLAYGATVLLVGVNQRWSIGLMALGVVTAVVPYATVPFELWLMRRGRLEGDWRREATEHPADGNVVSRLLRWGLGRPVLLTVLGVVGVAAGFTALLVVGPPRGRAACPRV